jgi:sulfonate transport system permease protein
VRLSLTALGRGLLGFAGLVVVWQLAALLVGDARSLPSPVAVAEQGWTDRSLYGIDLPPTLSSAAIGFLLGNAVAVGLGVMLALLPAGRRQLMMVVVVLYNIPIIAVAPLLEVLLSGDGPKIVMAALSVFFVTLLGTLAGFAAADSRSLDVVKAAGGGAWAMLRIVRIRAAMPSIFAGMAAGVPFAIVGAMVGEFFGGQTNGLGIMLVQALDNLNAARVWGIAVIVAIVGGAGLAIAEGLVRVLMPWSQTTAGVSVLLEQQPGSRGWVARTRDAIASLLITVLALLAIWVGGAKLLNLPPYVVRMPWDIWRYTVSEAGAEANRSALLGPLATSVGQALAGCGIGLLIGAAIAAATSLLRSLRPLVMPPVVALSSIPYLALVPILSVAIGRGAMMPLALGAIIALLPTVVNLQTGLASAPPALSDVLRASGASRLTILRRVEVPAACPYLFTSLRIAVPWALYGVILAEFLATGGGIGGAITNAAEIGNYNAAWSGAILVTIATALLYVAVGAVEQNVYRRFAA